MAYLEKLPWGSSLAFSQRLDEEVLASYKAAGIDCVELSFSFDYFMHELDFVKNWSLYARMARRSGIRLWSIHLPFSGQLDISQNDTHLRSITIYLQKSLIEAAANAGVSVVVLHPSSEPITGQERLERIKISREAIAQLNRICVESGLLLAVENLPRTCLANNSAEMIEILSGTGAGVVFDTNHSLVEDNKDFLKNLLAASLKIHSLHISDYDMIDERHRLPGDGINDWPGIFTLLEQGGYTGPLLYEVSRQPRERAEITLAQLTENMARLSKGMI